MKIPVYDLENNKRFLGTLTCNEYPEGPSLKLVTIGMSKTSLRYTYMFPEKPVQTKQLTFHTSTFKAHHKQHIDENTTQHVTWLRKVLLTDAPLVDLMKCKDFSLATSKGNQEPCVHVAREDLSHLMDFL